ncbi:hypothetical protein GCM10009133_11070 [Cocleimonas flava]|jgi:plasmid maintenance system killer protein|uniref:Phasin protein n=1 Tax=Cocleimonas flava TaxID=634765 RepID=A0A4R1F6D0_9GAMM|nr:MULTISPECIES: phasin family protein [Cocleimonas]MEB8434434.1 phasin family protein [Cocleimonas sp. KMM 6892]MEC4717327.1 phasin family protein [Cocleimonas sp. KMM 6895]MEC4746706.1 phasin family protein [Cocleimonas sp. KMM 6896]TCJ87468.1 phasin protein [Cocleimonas flava]
MQQWIDLNTKIANDSLATLKQFGELNVKTTEAFFAQQKEMTEGLTSTTEQNIEKLSAAKDPKDFFEMQNEMFQNSINFAMGNWKKAMSTVETNRDAYKKLSEKSLKTAKGNMDKVVESAKKTTTEATEAAKKAVKAAK